MLDEGVDSQLGREGRWIEKMLAFFEGIL